MKAKEIMTDSVVTIKPDTSVTEIARMMASKKVSGLPVVDDEGRIVGMVSEDDLLLKHHSGHVPHRLALFGLWVVPEEELEKAYCDARSCTLARDVMTRDVFVFEEEDEIDTIAESMVKRHINRVPIVRDDKLVGIVTRADILKAIAGGKG